MRRFFIEQIKKNADDLCTISGSEARHILKVLRMTEGDQFVLMDRTGCRYETEIESVAGATVNVRLIRPLAGSAYQEAEITLCQALLKSGPMDYLIEKTSELGVAAVRPFACERTVVKINGDGMTNKLRRWQEIAISAAKQSGRVAPADIFKPVLLTEVMQEMSNADCLKVMLWEREDSRDLKDVLSASAPESRVIGMVGPEGGFSSKEVTSVVDAGFIPVSLGRRILRAETAAITLTAIIQYELGDLCIRGSR